MKFDVVSKPPVSIGDVQPGDIFEFDFDDSYTRRSIEGAFRRSGDLPHLERPLAGERYLKLDQHDGFVWLRTDELVTYDDENWQEELSRLKVKRVFRVRKVELDRIK